MLAKRTSGLAKIEWEPVLKSVSRDPTVRTRSASRARVFVAGVPSSPMPPSCHHGALLDRALAGEGLRDRDAHRGGEPFQLGGGLRVDDPAAGDDQRLLGLGEQGRHGVDLGLVGGRPADHPVPLVEELGGEVVGVGLDVLGERQHHRTGLDRVDEGPHRRREGGEQLLRAG